MIKNSPRVQKAFNATTKTGKENQQ